VFCQTLKCHPYIRHFSQFSFFRTIFINLWKVVRAKQSPKGMHRYSKFSLSGGESGLWYIFFSNG
jgi:hypothetical protein